MSAREVGTRPARHPRRRRRRALVTVAVLAALAVLAGVGVAVADARRDDAPELVAFDEAFTDEGLRRCVARALDVDDGTALVPRDRLESLDRLSCAHPEPDVKSLDELRNLPGLTDLSLVLTDVRRLPADAVPRLTDLSLTATGITDLTGLAALPSLTSLQLGGRCWGPEAPADLDALAQITGLTGLSLDCLDVTDLTPVGRLTGLTSLYLSVPATDLGPLRSLTSLRQLQVREMDVDVAPLADLRVLRSLGLEHSRVADLSPLAALPELHSLDLSRATVGSLAPLADFAALESLRLTDTKAPGAGSLALDGVDIRR